MQHLSHSILKAEQLGKRFNREWIFRNFSFEFHSGKQYAITGANGSGKSTLLQVLWGQLPSSAGQLHYQVNGQGISLENAYAHVSMATPYLDLIDEFTIDELLHFHFKMRTLRNGTNLTELADRFELSHARKKAINHLSSGMRQRLKLGLAIYTEASFVFLDEPFTNLDKKAITWYQNQLHFLKQSIVLIASNDPNEYENAHETLQMSAYKSN